MSAFAGLPASCLSGDGARRIAAAISEGFCPAGAGHPRLSEYGYCGECRAYWKLTRSGFCVSWIPDSELCAGLSRVPRHRADYGFTDGRTGFRDGAL